MNSLNLRIFREIESSGAISFARFMELALYCPNWGYYERQREIGRHGDFFTSVSAGSLFGELLGFRFAEWLKAVPAPCVQIVESGAHAGQLAGDILRWFKEYRRDLFSRLEYVLVEPSPTHRLWQEKSLMAFSKNIRWVGDLAELGKVSGILVSNELLDAMPVHRLSWDASTKNWLELKVGLAGEKLAWQTGPLSEDLTDSIPPLSSELAGILPDGFSIEVSPAAIRWWAEAAGALAHGRLITIDYGLTEDEVFVPERSRGTVRAYSRHHVSDDLLANVGEQDITAHINFSLLQRAGGVSGLKTEGLLTQSRFLTQIFEQAWQAKGGLDDWTPARARQFQTLTHPEHLGRPFRVLIQSRLPAD